MVSRGQVAFNRIRTPRDSRSLSAASGRMSAHWKREFSSSRSNLPRTSSSAPFSISARCLPNISGKHHDLDRALVILEREHAHRIALLASSGRGSPTTMPPT